MKKPDDGFYVRLNSDSLIGCASDESDDQIDLHFDVAFESDNSFDSYPKNSYQIHHLEGRRWSAADLTFVVHLSMKKNFKHIWLLENFRRWF